MSLPVIELGDPAAPTIVLLHGAGMAAWMWQPQIVPLSARYHVLAPDLPGFGDAAASGPFSLEHAAAMVASVLRQRCDGRAHLCGLSLGAMVALQLAQDAAETVASLTLSAGQIHPNPLLMGVQQAIMFATPRRKFTEELPEVVPQHYPYLVEVAHAAARKTGKRGMLAAVRAAASADFRGLLPSIVAPTLILCGDQDTANLPASRKMAAAIPGAELRIIPGAGHVWNLEQPDVFTRTVGEFVVRAIARDALVRRRKR